MFWDKVASVYDLFENIYNSKVYNGTGKAVAKLLDSLDIVLECACGTGAITKYMAPKCSKLIATDYSDGMLRQAKKKCGKYGNVTFAKADITCLGYPDNSFDKAVAGNVIHLLPEPEKAMKEMERVVKDGGKIIIPTYINSSQESSRKAVKFLEKLGADFKRQFDMETYQRFFSYLGYENVEYSIVEGRMPCAIAVITKRGV